MELLIKALPVPKDERLIVGLGNSEDAAVYRLNDERAIIATIDVITPLVDDPVLFGAIAATNAFSDVYAMGGRPLIALSFLGTPPGFPIEITTEISCGGANAALKAGAPVVGGHSVESKDLMYGLAVIGEADPDKLFLNSGFEVGDELLLTKPLGTGGLTTAVKNGKLKAEELTAVFEGMTLSNGAAVEPLHRAGVKAVTDVTGFGLLGHAAEVARASGVQLAVESAALPEYPRAREMFAKKQLTRGDKTNFQYAKSLGPVVGEAEALLRDPQTSGGLLAAVKPDRLERLLDELHRAGYPEATRIGEVREGRGLAIF